MILLLLFFAYIGVMFSVMILYFLIDEGLNKFYLKIRLPLYDLLGNLERRILELETKKKVK